MRIFKNHHFKSNPAEFYQQSFGYSTQVSFKMWKFKALCTVARHKSWKLNLQKQTSYSTEEQLQETFWDLDWEATTHELLVKCNGKKHISRKCGDACVPKQGTPKGARSPFYFCEELSPKWCWITASWLLVPPFGRMDVDDTLRLQKVTIEIVHMLYNLPCGKTLKEIKRFGLPEERRKNKRWRWLNYSFISARHWSGFSSTKERTERINSHKIKKTDKFIYSTKLCFYSNTNYQGKWWILHNLICPKHGLEVCLEDMLSSNINHWAQEINLYDLMVFS